MQDLSNDIENVIKNYVGEIIARSIAISSIKTSGVDSDVISTKDLNKLKSHIGVGVRLYLKDEAREAECLSLVGSVLTRFVANRRAFRNVSARKRVDIDKESDIVTARSRGMEVCRSMGFSHSMQIRVATTISELARNIVRYAQEGYIEINSLEGSMEGIEIIAKDEGPGIENIDDILGGRYQSKTGLGKGLVGVKRLMDEFRLTSQPGKGTMVEVKKYME